MRGERIGRLHGVPVTIKDLAITKDMPTQNGSLIFEGNQPTEDTPVVPRLRDEGAIILGKTTTSEFGWTGVSHSPADRHHAQSLEARLQRRRLLGRRRRGRGGRVRAAAPGQRRRRLDPHAVAFLRRVRPEAELRPRAVLSGRHRRLDLAHRPDDPHRRRRRADAGGDGRPASARLHDSCEAGPADYLARLHEGIRGKRIAYSPDLGVARVDPEVAALVKAAVARFTELGATVEEVATPWAAAGPGADPLLLGRAHDPAGAASGEVGSADGPRPRRLHQGGARTYSVAEYQLDARAQDGAMSPPSIAGSRTGISC